MWRQRPVKILSTYLKDVKFRKNIYKLMIGKTSKKFSGEIKTVRVSTGIIEEEDPH